MRGHKPLSGLLCVAVLGVALTACGEAEPTPSPSPSPSASAAATTSATAAATATAVPSPTPSPSPTPVPLSLEPPAEMAEGVVDFSLSPNIPPEGRGQLIVNVTNMGDEAIEEIVLRWPTELNATLFLAPFEPGPDRMVNPLVVEWTRWVEGPGTRGEPAGTTTLGYGPLDPGVTLAIDLVASWRTAAPVDFDLQFLDREALLLTTTGEPAQTRITLAPST